MTDAERSFQYDCVDPEIMQWASIGPEAERIARDRYKTSTTGLTSKAKTPTDHIKTVEVFAAAKLEERRKRLGR